MRPNAYVFNLQAVHPLWRIVLVVLGIGLLGFFLFFGLIMLAVFATIALVAGTVLAIRGWWLRRKLGGRPAPGAAIEGEFVVIERQRINRHED